MLLIGSWLASSKGGKVVAPYMGGANVPGDFTKYRSTAGGEFDVSVSGVFLKNSIDEAALNKLAMGIGVVITVALILVEVI